MFCEFFTFSLRLVYWLRAVWLNILSLIMTMKTIFRCLVDAWTVSKITKLHRTYLRQRVTTRRSYYDKLFQRAMYLSQSSICQTTVVQPVKSLTADSTYKHSFRVNLTGSELSHVKRGIAKYQMKTADALREPSTLHDSDRLHLALRVFRRNWRAATISSLLWQLQAVLDFTAWLRRNWICRLWILSWFLQSRRKILSVCFYLNREEKASVLSIIFEHDYDSIWNILCEESTIIYIYYALQNFQTYIKHVEHFLKEIEIDDSLG